MAGDHIDDYRGHHALKSRGERSIDTVTVAAGEVGRRADKHAHGKANAHVALAKAVADGQHNQNRQGQYNPFGKIGTFEKSEGGIEHGRCLWVVEPAVSPERAE